MELQGLVTFIHMSKYNSKHEKSESKAYEKSEKKKGSKAFEEMEYRMHGNNRGKNYKGYKGKGGCSCE